MFVSFVLTRGEKKKKNNTEKQWGEKMKVFIKAFINSLGHSSSRTTSKAIPPFPNFYFHEYSLHIRNPTLRERNPPADWFTKQTQTCCWRTLNLNPQHTLQPTPPPPLQAHIHWAWKFRDTHVYTGEAERPTHPISLQGMWVSGRRRFPCPRFLCIMLMCVTDD